MFYPPEDNRKLNIFPFQPHAGNGTGQIPLSMKRLMEGRTLVLVVPLPRQLQTGARSHPEWRTCPLKPLKRGSMLIPGCGCASVPKGV